MFQHLGEHAQAKEYPEKAGNKAKAALSYGNLGIVFESLNKYDKAKELHEKALAIRMEIGDRDGKASSNGNLFQCHGECVKAKEYHEKALAILMKIRDREGEASSFANPGVLFLYLNKDDIGEEFNILRRHFRSVKKLEPLTENFNFVATFYLNKDDTEEEYLEKVLLISKEIGTPGGEFRFRCNMTAVILYQWEDSCIIGMRAL